MIKLTGTVMMRRPLCLLLLVLALCCDCLSVHATFEDVNSDALTFGHLRAVMAEEGSDGTPGGKGEDNKGDGVTEQTSSKKEEAKIEGSSPQRNESEAPKESQTAQVTDRGTNGPQGSQKALPDNAQDAQQPVGSGQQENAQISDGEPASTPTPPGQKETPGPPVAPPTREDGTGGRGQSPNQTAQEEGDKVDLPDPKQSTSQPAEPAASSPSSERGQPENTTPATVQKTDNTATDVRGTDPSHTPGGTQSVGQQQSEEHVPRAAEQSAGTTAAQPNDNAAAETAQSGSQAGADRTAPGTTVSHQTLSQENNPNMTRTTAIPNEEETTGGVTNSTKDTSAVTAAVSGKNVSNVTGGEDGSGIVRVWMHTPLMLLLFFITALSLTGL